MGGQDMRRKGMGENGRGVDAGGVEAWGLRRRHNLNTYRWKFSKNEKGNHVICPPSGFWKILVQLTVGKLAKLTDGQ